MRNTVSVRILIADDCWGGLAILVKEALAIAGTLHARNSDIQASALFDVKLTGLSRFPVRSFTGPVIDPEATIAQREQAQVIVVPPYFFPNEERQALMPGVRKWLVDAYDAGALIVCLASGVRLLAETGLLDGHDATGNRSDQRVFARHYPQIRFNPDTPLVIDGRIISAASINPAMDACSYLVSHFIGDSVAHKFSRYTNTISHPTYERMALRQSSFKQHGDQRIKQAQEFFERNFKEDISVEDGARRSAMSVRNFSRRFQEAVGMPPHTYIMRCRVEHAKDLLQQPSVPVLQVALGSGFGSEISLRRAFQQLLATTPSAYRQVASVKTAG